MSTPFERMSPGWKALYKRMQARDLEDSDKHVIGIDHASGADKTAFFTPSPVPIPPAAYHNVFPPITSEGIQEAAKRLQELRAQWDKEDAEIFASVPMPERLQPRVPDLCPDDMGFARVDIIKQEQRRAYESAHGPARGCDDCEEERNR